VSKLWVSPVLVFVKCTYVNMYILKGTKQIKYCLQWHIYTGYTQKNGAVLIVKTIETAPFFCVYSVE
jgi:hypothetical protein